MSESKGQDRRPPYVPWGTFAGLVQKLAAAGHAPTMIDNHVTASMDGITRSQLRSAMKFLGLIDQANRTLPRLDELVTSHGTDKWKADLTALLHEKYAPIVKNLNLKSMAMGELKAAFKEHGGADAQVGEKAIRFYLSGLKEAGVEFSPYVSAPRSSSSGGARRATRKAKTPARNGSEEGREEELPAGATRWPIPIPGKANALIIVPNDIDLDDWSMIDSVVRAFITLALKANEKE
jgi:hypothetical protein